VFEDVQNHQIQVQIATVEKAGHLFAVEVQYVP
jgi:hypothetical protein